MILSTRTAEMLEWPAFLHLYSNFVDSSAGRERVVRLNPCEDLERELKISRESLACAQNHQTPSFGHLENISPILEKAGIENEVLEGMQCVHVLRLASLNNEIRSQLRGWKAVYPHLQEEGSRLPDLKSVESAIDAIIEPDGQVKEDATPELSRIRKQIAHLKTRVERSLERYFKDKRFRDAMQEDYVTYRHGRAVLVVRAEQKNVIRGVIHGESGSGASVYLEPLNVLEPNNELAQLEDRRQQELLRVLRELTEIIRSNAAPLQFALQQLTALDLIFARGRFGKAFRCVLPEVTDAFRLALFEARHPLLENTLRAQERSVVPLSLELNEEQKLLVITGPNTGGKTVALKTAGLLCLLTHYALPIPAAEGSVIPKLSKIDADIGDQQSISESLSTFSSHIINIVGILSKLQPQSLILLDELGTGTDPEEGAPLAVAIVQELLRHPVKAIITSHHSAMKIFAFNDPQAVTAAMEFDPQNLQPTYRVLIDQIGASHAFDIAQRLGLPASLLQQARSLTNVDQQKLQEFQEKLHERIRELEKRQGELDFERRDWERRYTEQSTKLRAQREELEGRLKDLHEKNTDLIRVLNARVENLLAGIRDAELRQELRKQYQQKVAPAIEQLQSLTSEAGQGGSEELHPGDRVWVNLYKDYGEVVGVRKGQAELIIRNKKFTVPVGMVEKKEPIVQTLPKGIHIQLKERETEREINLIGKTVEEALALVDKYLDDAFVSQLPEVRVIHGHGTGRLKRAIEEMLASHPHVAGFHPESAQRGGAGVTVVELKT